MSTTRLIAILAAAGLALVGCEREGANSTTTTKKSTTTTTTTAPGSTPRTTTHTTTDTTKTPNQVRPDPTKQPDNTGQNKPDRDPASVTPEDQSNADQDVDLTAAIRRAVMADDTLSINAKNSKIIADKNGTVTLRGVVETQAEKDAIESKAKSIAGVKNVNNLLDVKTK
jgi:hypothetical protein